MPLTKDQIDNLVAVVRSAIAVPLTMTDRIDVARFAVARTIALMAPVVTMDQPKESPKSEEPQEQPV